MMLHRFRTVRSLRWEAWREFLAELFARRRPRPAARFHSLRWELLEPRHVLTAVPFSAQPAVTTAANVAMCVAAGDVDGDGDLDMLSASFTDDKFAWYENTVGNGTAWTLRTISTSADGAQCVTAADMDGDGDLDVLGTMFVADKIVWYENTAGNGSAWTMRTISTAVDGPFSAAAADVDGDGDLDVVLTSTIDNKIAWCENTLGTGTAWTLRTISITAAGAYSAAAADIDGDGDLDVLSASRYDDKVAWYENTAGNGSAWTLRTISITADRANSVTAADVDGDGDMDVLSTSLSDDKVAWYENTAGNGSAWTIRTISTSANSARSVAVADLDGDGDLDALSASLYDDKIAWYENTSGNGTSWILRTISIAANGAKSVVAADVDGDGDLDVLSASLNDDKIAWYRNDRPHLPIMFVTQPSITTTADGASSLFSADLDGDGDLDVLSASRYDDKIAWYENSGGDGTSWTLRTISTIADNAFSVFAADLDGDGDLDVLSASFSDDRVVWYENTAGNGTAWTLWTISTSAGSPRSVSAADLDGDGDLDVLSASSNDDKIAWYENDGASDPNFTLHTISTAADGAGSIFVADVDGDGDLDVLSASSFDDKIAWYENTAGNGTAWTVRTISTTADGAAGVFAADVDGDGDMDVLSSSTGDDKIAWYENTAGNGTAWTLRTISTSADAAVGVYAADVDGDGDLDVLSASILDNKITWYRNDGAADPTFMSRTISTAANQAVAVAAADIDGDGDLDVLSASRNDDKIAWYRNDPNLDATPPTGQWNAVADTNVALDSITITFDESVENVSLNDFTLNGVDVGALSGAALTVNSESSYTITGLAAYTSLGSPNTTYTIAIAGTHNIHDLADNLLSGLPSETWLMDTTPPTGLWTAVADTTTAVAGATITFSEAVQNVSLDDFTLNGTSLSALAGVGLIVNSATGYSLTGLAVHTAGVGFYTLASAAGNNIQDLAGGALSGASVETWSRHLLVMGTEGTDYFRVQQVTGGAVSVTQKLNGKYVQVAVLDAGQPLSVQIVIQSLGGDDTVKAKGALARGMQFFGGTGKDKLTGGDGDDVLDGSDGDDTITTGLGADRVFGGAGNDRIINAGGDDVIDAGEGKNSVTAKAGNNTITAGSGDDTITTAAGNDVIDAGNGKNNVKAGDGNNTVVTGKGDDRITTGKGNDLIRAGAGKDRITAGDGNDILVGNEGDDTLGGGKGRDIVIGGAGVDKITGGTEGNILIAGSTFFDADDTSLRKFLSEWTSARSYADRIKNLSNDNTSSTFAQRLNDIYLIGDHGPSQTVFDDGVIDTLTGGTGLDWYLAEFEGALLDKLKTPVAGEVVSDIDV